MGDQPTETPDPFKAIEALGAKFDAFIESSKPKPEKSDRALLEEIAEGFKNLPGSLAELLKPSETSSTTAPPVKDGAPVTPAAESKPKRKNPFFS